MEDNIKFEYEFSLKSIREHREEQGISQSELSRRTSGRVAQGVISDLESGFRKLTSNTALLISNALKTNIFGLCIAQEMQNKGIALKDREGLVKAISDGKADLLKAYKSMDRVKDLDLDFGERDQFGRKIHPSELEARKRIKETGEKEDFGGELERDSFGRRISKRESDYKKRKRAEKRKEKALDFGDRDSFGRKRIAKKHISAHDFDDLDLEGLDADQKFLAKLNRIIEMGEKRRKGLE